MVEGLRGAGLPQQAVGLAVSRGSLGTVCGVWRGCPLGHRRCPPGSKVTGGLGGGAGNIEQWSTAHEAGGSVGHWGGPEVVQELRVAGLPEGSGGTGEALGGVGGVLSCGALR